MLLSEGRLLFHKFIPTKCVIKRWHLIPQDIKIATDLESFLNDFAHLGRADLSMANSYGGSMEVSCLEPI